MNNAHYFRRFFKYALIACLFILVFVYAMFQGGFVSWFLFYSVTTVLVFTVLIALFPFRVRKIERVLSRDVIRTGESVQVTIRIEKHRFQPFFFLRLEDQLSGSFHHSRPSTLFFFSFQRRLTFTYSVDHAKRGIYEFGPIALVFSDLFGLVERKVFIPYTNTLYVLPNIHPLTLRSIMRGTKELEWKQVQKLNQGGHSISGVREYVPGDRITRIDWKQSARSLNLQTKEFESFQAEEVILAFDSFMSVDKADSFEQTVEVAASLLADFTKRNTTVQLAVKADHWLVSRITMQSLIEGLKLLAQVNPQPDRIEKADPVYYEWQGSHVYFVCIDLNKRLIEFCLALLKQQTTVTICTAGAAADSNSRSTIGELERVGIKVLHVSIH